MIGDFSSTFVMQIFKAILVSKPKILIHIFSPDLTFFFSKSSKNSEQLSRFSKTDDKTVFCLIGG